MATTQDIHHPAPKRVSSSTTGSGSARLLSSHHSVLEALNSHPDTIPTSNNNIYNINNIDDNSNNNNNNTYNNNNINTNNNLLDLGFSTTSWQSVSNQWMARSTSSVLSSSDTEEDQDESTLRFQYENIPAAYAPSSVSAEQRSASKSTDLSSQNDDEKTIEIDMNSSIHNNFSDTNSSFILPHFNSPSFTNMSSFSSEYIQQTPSAVLDTLGIPRILVIGHKKSNFLRELPDQDLREIFTLNLNEPSKIVVVIFDGLIKIGNILNFIKYNEIGNKLFIPIFKNINHSIIERILKNYRINLLCSPICLNNRLEISNLLRFLKTDYKALAMDDGSEILLHQDIQMVDQRYQLVQVGLEESVYASMDHLVAPENKSIIIKHHSSDCDHCDNCDRTYHPYKNTNDLLNSKKLKSRKRRRNNFLYIGLALTVGIGIGVTTALTISYLKFDSYRDSSRVGNSPNPDTLKSLSKTVVLKVYDGILKRAEDSSRLLKQSLISFKQNVSGLSCGVFRHIQQHMSGMDEVWNGLLNNMGQSYVMFW